MAWVIGVIAGLIGLYLWLLGHWFARIVVFLAISLPTSVLAWLWCVEAHQGAGNGVAMVVGLAAIGWMVSGIPLYYRIWVAMAPENRALSLYFR